jgi:FAD/FMN-containing dehydrogenase/Fe-S oxidoreductase
MSKITSQNGIALDLARLLGEKKVLSDFAALTAYAIDASIYKATPQAVVLLQGADDLERVLAYAKTRAIPLTARSGGTNLTGNAVGEGIILEFSRMNRLLELDREGRSVRVEPGINYAELNRRLAPSGLMFAPDPSSGEMCKLGGMLGNNAAGPHTLRYGSTKDNTIAIKLLFSSGRWLSASALPLDAPAWRGLEHPELVRLVELVSPRVDLISRLRRKVSKNSSGYNVFDLADGLVRGIVDLPKLFIGSEGTLALTVEATLKLVPRPVRTATLLVYLKETGEVAETVNALLPLSPSALEMIDAHTMNLIGRKRFNIPEEARALLLMEMDEIPGEEAPPLSDRVERCRRILGRFSLSGSPEVAFDPERREALWSARKAIYPTLYRFDARRKPINFADDVVVPAERLSELMAYLDRLFEETEVPVAIFGHVGDGNAHITPLLDLNDPGDFNKMIRLSHRIHETVIEQFGGSLCGEHGDGRVRAEFLKELYGDELYGLFWEIKRLFDPEGLLNPGVKLSSVPFTEGIDLHRFTKSCATCAKCNTVCPVYDVMGEETNAARGWFHVVTAPNYSYDAAARVVEACINCKSCRVVCPAGIDVSEEILKRRAERPNPLTGPIFELQATRSGIFESGLKLLAWTQPLWDHRPIRFLFEMLTRPLLRLLAPTARIPRDLVLPRLARRHLRDRHAGCVKLTGEVAYFHGCAANYFDDGVGDSVIDLLSLFGVEAVLPPQRCSGTPIQTYGHAGRVRENARFNLASLAPFSRVVTGCASCTFMLKDYPSLFPDGPEKKAAEALSKKVMHVTEYLVKELKVELPSNEVGSDRPTERVTYHSSCHLRAAGVTEEPRRLLQSLPGVSYVEMTDADRCAGGAGTFCVKNPEMSRKIFERKRRGIDESGAEVVATSCPACMVQLNSGLRGSARVRHVAQVLLERLKGRT